MPGEPNEPFSSWTWRECNGHPGQSKSVSSSDLNLSLVGRFSNPDLPIKAAGEKTAKLVKGARLVSIKDGPHAINWTHAEEVNTELVGFLGKGAAKRAAAAP